MAQNVVGSNFPTLASDQLRPTKRGYGQNQFGGASSDVPGEKTTSGFLPETRLADAVNNQTRKVSGQQYPTTFGNRNRKGE